MKKTKIEPILKWAGGKRQLLGEINKYLPQNITTYVEPFIGGGALLFDLQPKKAIINDLNKELINVYEVIRDFPDELIEILKLHTNNNSSDYFYSMRNLDRESKFLELNSVEKAARIIYLNRTCYNGLFRVNRIGQFNTPYGKYKNPKILDIEKIEATSQYLNKNNIKVISGDYKLALKGLRRGSFVYFDPPYLPINTASFTGYTELGFSLTDHTMLRDECIKLHSRGINIMISNSDTPEIRELFNDKSIFKIRTLSATRKINSKKEERGEITELLITNY